MKIERDFIYVAVNKKTGEIDRDDDGIIFAVESKEDIELNKGWILVKFVKEVKKSKVNKNKTEKLNSSFNAMLIS